MASFSLTGKFGGVVVHGAESASKAVTGYVGRKSGIGASRLYQRMGGKELNERLQQSRFVGASAVGRGLQGLTDKGTKEQVKKAGSRLNVSGMTDDELIMAAQGARGDENTLAVLAESQKRGKLTKLRKVGGEEDLNTWLQKNDHVFKEFNQGKLQGDINKAIAPNVLREAAAIQAAAEVNAPILKDEHGLFGKPGAEVDARALKGEAENAASKAEEAIKQYREGKIKIDGMEPEDVPVEHRGTRVPAGELLRHAQEASAASDKVLADQEAQKDSVPFVDRTGYLGQAGKEYPVGDFLKQASEKFYGDLDKKDASQILGNDLFGKKPAFGLSKEALDLLSRAVAHGIATSAPSLAGTLAGKLDNSEKLKNFIGKYTEGLDKAVASGKITPQEARERKGGIKQIRKGMIYGYGPGSRGGEEGGAPPAAPTPASGGH